MTLDIFPLPLSESLRRRVEYAASILHRPIEEILTATIDAALPEVDDAPADLQEDLMRMTWLGDEELWQIAAEQMTSDNQEQLAELSILNDERPLTSDEESRLEELRDEYGQVTLRRSRAYAILSLRSGKPLLVNM